VPVTEDDPVVQELANKLAKKKFLEILATAQGIEKGSVAEKA
jgi:hypothetical protein